MPCPSTRPLNRAVATVASVALSLIAIAACGGTTEGGTTKADGGGRLILPLDLDSGKTKDVHVAPPVDAPMTHEAAPPPVDAGVDVLPAPTDAELNTYPAFKPIVPQVETNGGPLLTTPIVIPVLFAGDAYQSIIEGFSNAIVESDYWTTAVGEYGVGKGMTAPAIVLDETMPSTIDDDQLQVWLTNEIGLDPRFGALGPSVFDAGSSDAGPSDAGIFDANAPVSDAIASTATAPNNSVYVLYMPEGVDVTMAGGHSCSDYGGYHNSFYYGPNGSNVTYAVVPRCASLGGLNGPDVITGAASHEIAEASTDPEVGSVNGEHDAYTGVDNNHIYWEFVLGGGELADMCAQFPDAFYHPADPSLSSYMVQRIWSNKQAALGNDPCQPTLGATAEPFYFNAVPVQVRVNANYMGFNIPTLGVVAPVGTPTTIELQLFSTAPTDGQDWSVSGFDANSMINGSQPDLIFSSAVMGTNGDTVVLTVTNMGTDGSSSHPFIVQSTLGELQNWWIGVVTDS